MPRLRTRDLYHPGTKGAHMKKIFLLLLVVAIGLFVAKQLSHSE
jgi:hypothetical protein